MLFKNRFLLTKNLFIPCLFFILFIVTPAFANTATYIPVKSWIYEYLEELQLYGLIRSGLLSSKPISRLEGARLVKEAITGWDVLPPEEQGRYSTIGYMVQRLKKEFMGDLTPYSYFKPVNTAYGRYVHNDSIPLYLNTNNDGDRLIEGGNTRAGFSSILKLGRYLSFYANPEYRTERHRTFWFTKEIYGVISMANLDVLVGREAMWWGNGVHGSLLLSNNAEPLNSVLVTSRYPFLLPWYFKKLGPFKPIIFLSRLEENRVIPRAKFLGMRFDFRPRPYFQFGLSRVIMFDGHGRKKLNFADWIKILLAENSAEHTNSPINNNQLLSIDFSFLISHPRHGHNLFKGLKFYGEIGAEDSSGNGWPKERAYLAGLYFLYPFNLRNINLRIEWASTALNQKHNAWYTHGVYQSGYRYKGNIIGHHIDADGEDIFARLEYNKGWIKGGAEIDRERKKIHSGNTTRVTWMAFDVVYYLTDILSIGGGYGVEKISNDENHSLWTIVRMDL